MTNYNFGSVILVPFPFTNFSSTKKRPTVIISSQIYNQTKPDLIVMPVTSQINNPLVFGELLVTDFSVAGLIKPSVVKPVITTIEKSLVIRTLGQLQPSDCQKLREIIHKYCQLIVCL